MTTELAESTETTEFDLLGDLCASVVGPVIIRRKHFALHHNPGSPNTPRILTNPARTRADTAKA